MLLYLFITCLSFVFFKTLPLQPLPPWACEMRLLSPWFWKVFPFFTISKLTSKGFSIFLLSRIPSKMSLKRLSPKVENIEEDDDAQAQLDMMSVLDLPELVLECILEKLPPDALFRMTGVCTCLRERCRSDHLWEKHMKQKWGRVIGHAAYREWQWQIASKTDLVDVKQQQLHQGKQKGLMRILSLGWPFSFSWIRSIKLDDDHGKHRSSLLPDSILSWYLALETGRFWFPAQVYNRENGHVGFMLSCYDAELSYDPRTDTFQARYPPHGRRAVAVEKGVPWERLRARVIDTPPHDLHISDSLNELRPGDHIEIQWRRNKEFPYGLLSCPTPSVVYSPEKIAKASWCWWYGVVGHLESCDGNENYCLCHTSDTVVLEFNQYTQGSRWRCTNINRRDHREEGNEADGFYGGIRKLRSKQEICPWRRLWPTEVLE